MRVDGRALDEMRKVKATLGFSKFAEGSCLIEMGDTMVLCNASVEDRVPPHVQSGGWVTGNIRCCREQIGNAASVMFPSLSSRREVLKYSD